MERARGFWAAVLTGGAGLVLFFLPTVSVQTLVLPLVGAGMVGLSARALWKSRSEVHEAASPDARHHDLEPAGTPEAAADATEPQEAEPQEPEVQEPEPPQPEPAAAEPEVIEATVTWLHPAEFAPLLHDPYASFDAPPQKVELGFTLTEATLLEEDLQSLADEADDGAPEEFELPPADALAALPEANAAAPPMAKKRANLTVKATTHQPGEPPREANVKVMLRGSTMPKRRGLRTPKPVNVQTTTYQEGRPTESRSLKVQLRRR